MSALERAVDELEPIDLERLDEQAKLRRVGMLLADDPEGAEAEALRSCFV